MGATLALAMAIGASLAGSSGSLGTAPLVLVAIGVAFLPLGVAFGRRGHPLVGRGLSVSGVVVALAALTGAIALSPPLVILLPALSSGIGLLFLAFGVHFVSGSAARALSLAGLTLVFLATVANATVAEQATWQPVAAVALVVVAWDTADRAITLGRRIGTDAGTVPVELMGVATTGAIGFTGVAVAMIATRVPIESPSVIGLALLLAAATALVLVLSSVPDPG
ncbi:hypothetical protein [Saliphagus sp. LR7]|uniref:DUF7519 family protein n=1 Tax=Saliphagus sp. LR7 TaxID=2282654 RepID=UPI000DF73BB9|nr:hypothetical protein [Saliphagus sp. LR7]